MNDFKRGKKIFGVGTNFDYYCLQYKNTDNNITTIKDIDGNEQQINLNSYEFIPNGMFNVFNELIAKRNEKKVRVLYSRSAYGTDKKHMSKKKNDNYKYQCCYIITVKDGLKKYYSSTNKNGHFNVQKVIWSNGLGTSVILDDNGDYGLTQYSYGIIDSKENLSLIKKTMESSDFIKLMSYCKFTNNKYDYKVIKTFRQDFYVYYKLNYFISDK
jgi:hypothetical protein